MSLMLLEEFPVPAVEHWSSEGLDPNRGVELYHSGGSLCSQKVRLVLHEKGVDWQEHRINLAAEENLAPAYMRINPRGVVPTLIDGDNTVFDSRTIMLYIDRSFPGPPLLPSGEEARRNVDQWLTLQDEFPVRELTYGNLGGPIGRMMRGKVPKRIALIERLQRENPDLAQAYAVKLADTRNWIRDQADTKTVSDINARLVSLLDQLEKHLAAGPWIAGDSYSLADIAWTTLLARAEVVGLTALVNAPSRPRVSDYYARLRARPSFDAQVTAYQKKIRLLKEMIRGKFSKKF